MTKRINWPTAAVLIVAIVLLWSIAVFGERFGMAEGSHEAITAAVGSISVALAAWLPRVFGKDADGDGVPDIIDGDSDGS